MKKFPILCLLGLLAFCFPKYVGAQGNSEAAKLARQGSEAAKTKDWDSAIEAFTKANRMDHKYGQYLVAALQQRATAEVAERKFPEAIADFTVAIEVSPKDAGIYERRAAAEMKINEMDKALADYSEAIKINSNEVRYYLYRSYIYEVKGDIKNSMVDTEKVLKMQKGNAEAKSRKERLQKIQSLNAPPPQVPLQAPPPSKKP